MNAKDLKKGRKYYYTLPVEWVKVKYLYETINGYMFTANGVENVLTKQAVEQHIEEV